MAACEWCGESYEPTVRANGVRGGKPQRFCSDRCVDDSYLARRRASRRRPAERLPSWPKVTGT